MPIEENWWFNYPWDFYNKKVYILKKQTTVVQIRKTFFTLKVDPFLTVLYFPFTYNNYPLKIINI